MISRIEALNYRSLQYVSEELSPFQILIGPNASGKSTFLDVVTFLSDFVNDGLDDTVLFRFGSDKGRANRLDELIFNQSADHFELAIELPIPKYLHPAVNEAGPGWDVARYAVSIGKTSNGELDLIDESLWVLDSNYRINLNSHEEDIGGMSPLDTDSPTTLPSELALDTYGRVVVANGRSYGKEAATYIYENGGGATQFRSGPRKAALATLPEDPDRFPIAIWVRDMLREGIRVLALNSAALRRPVSPSASRKFNVEGANLPLVIRDLQRDHPQVYQDWIAHVQTILPELSGIHVVERSDDRHLYLAILYHSAVELVPSWLVSDGTLRLLALTLIAYLPDQASSIYLIEEPENGIHPKALAGVFQSLSSVYRGQVLVATHSPLLLGLVEPEQILCFSKTETGAVNIVRGDRHPALRNWHGDVDLSTLYAAGVLG